MPLTKIRLHPLTARGSTWLRSRLRRPPKGAAANQYTEMWQAQLSRFDNGASCTWPGSSPRNFVTAVAPSTHHQGRLLLITDLTTFAQLCKTLVDFLVQEYLSFFQVFCTYTPF